MTSKWQWSVFIVFNPTDHSLLFDTLSLLGSQDAMVSWCNLLIAPFQIPLRLALFLSNFKTLEYTRAWLLNLSSV